MTDNNLEAPVAPADATEALKDGARAAERMAREQARERMLYAKEGKVAGLRLVRESLFSVKAPDERAPIRSPKDVVEFMEPFARRETTEVFWVILLDSQHRVLEIPTENEETGEIEPVVGPVTITRGILNSSLTHPRETFKPAILHGAAAIILVHNHPSGNPTPSADDKIITEQLVSAGRVLDIPVHDHIILGTVGAADRSERYTSLAESGLI